MEKFVYVRVADDNANAWPISSFIEARYIDANEIDLLFEGAIGIDSVDAVRLVYGGADSAKKALLAIGKVFAEYKGGSFLRLADKVGNKYATSEITDVTSITLGA
mgnify:FL=1|tara:strand:+ start:109 stop:423 length:315 start_codon:yes stop_codon:yes gene_type:complete